MIRKKILVLTPRYPYPVIGGDRLRIYEVCKALAAECDLTLLSLCESIDELNMPLPEDGIFRRIARVFLPRWQSYLNCFFAFPVRKPLQVAYYQSKVFAKKFDELINDHDAVLCHLIRTSEYALGCNKPVVTEFTDAISLNYARIKNLAKSGGVKNLIFSLEQSRLERYEKDVGSRSDLNVFVSSVDANYLFPENTPEGLKTLVCSNGVDVQAYPFNIQRRSREIAFIGNMQSVQNMDAAIWFAKEVMPLITEEGFTFKVVGRISQANQIRLNGYDGVRAIGGVTSVVDAVSTSFIGVCPMRIGAGVQNKILEYMALGLPCVTSSMGYEGLEAMRDRELIVEDEPKKIAERIKGLYANEKQRFELARAARSYVELNHSWRARLDPLVASIQSLNTSRVAAMPF